MQYSYKYTLHTIIKELIESCLDFVQNPQRIPTNLNLKLSVIDYF